MEAKQKDECTDRDSILCCALCCILCRVLDGISAYEQRFRRSKIEGVNDIVHDISPSSPCSTHPYATPESANIESPAVQCTAVPCGASYALDETSPPHFSTLDSYATPDFKGIEEEGKRAGEITKAEKEVTQIQTAPPRVSEASPQAISPPDPDLTLADASVADVSVPAFQRPAYQGPAVPVPAFQGPAFSVPAFQGPAFK